MNKAFNYLEEAQQASGHRVAAPELSGRAPPSSQNQTERFQTWGHVWRRQSAAVCCTWSDEVQLHTRPGHVSPNVTRGNDQTVSAPEMSVNIRHGRKRDEAVGDSLWELNWETGSICAFFNWVFLIILLFYYWRRGVLSVQKPKISEPLNGF